MSVLIKGMEMPGKCENCPCYDYIDYVCRADDCFAPFDVENPEERSEHCPLIEVPTPHGRLIDADKLQAAIHGCLCETCETFECEKGMGCLVEDVFNLIDQIEAEVSE